MEFPTRKLVITRFRAQQNAAKAAVFQVERYNTRP